MSPYQRGHRFENRGSKPIWERNFAVYSGVWISS